jgi:hypothetical protein
MPRTCRWPLTNQSRVCLAPLPNISPRSQTTVPVGWSLRHRTGVTESTFKHGQKYTLDGNSEMLSLFRRRRGLRLLQRGAAGAAGEAHVPRQQFSH